MSTFLGSPGPLLGAVCDTDEVPAATLLFPYFEVDLERPEGLTTLISVANQDEAPALVQVVLWTDFAVPTLAFPIYLTGFDIQTINLRDVLVHGNLPATGSGVSPHGQVSGPAEEFPGCNTGSEPGVAPVFPIPALSDEELEGLRAFHSGACAGGLRAAANWGDSVTRGYVTMDVARRCSLLTPADEGYFGAGEEGVADHRNILTGDYFFVERDQNFAQGEAAVHVESFPGEFEAGQATFYGRYVGGTGIDGREPLGSIYSSRYLTGGAFDGGTRAIVWRDTGSPDAEPVGCGDVPSWAFLPPGVGLRSYRIYFDEEENAVSDRGDVCLTFPQCGSRPTAWATQAVSFSAPQDPSVHPPFEFGMARWVLRDPSAQDPAEWPPLQGWVGVLHSAQGKYSVGLPAARLDSLCEPGLVQPGPGDFE